MRRTENVEPVVGRVILMWECFAFDKDDKPRCRVIGYTTDQRFAAAFVAAARPADGIHRKTEVINDLTPNASSTST